MKRACAALLIATVVTTAGAAGGQPLLEARLQGIVDGFAAASAPAAPGVVVHVIHPSSELDRTFVAGRADRAGPPLSAEHTFRIASNTKTYVAAAVLILAEQGRLALDDPLARHLPPDQRDLLAADGYDLEAMTLRQVLAHTSGLFEHPADPRYEEAILADPQRVWTADEQIRLCAEWGDPVGGPGEKFVYSDTGYIILGRIIEQTTGQNLGVAVHGLLDYGKLGLDTTWWEVYEPAPAQAGAMAHQYYGDEDTRGWHPSLDLHGGGGIVTDARDLALFMRLLLTGEVLAEEASLAAMTTGGTDTYRLGLIHAELAGSEAFGHTGFWNTFAFHVPSLDLTVAGAVLSHHAPRGQQLAAALVAGVSNLTE